MVFSDCKMARGLNLLLGIFFGLVALALFITGVTYLPVIGIILGAVFLVISFLFLIAPRDSSCYLTR